MNARTYTSRYIDIFLSLIPSSRGRSANNDSNNTDRMHILKSSQSPPREPFPMGKVVVGVAESHLEWKWDVRIEIGPISFLDRHGR